MIYQNIKKNENKSIVVSVTHHNIQTVTKWKVYVVMSLMSLTVHPISI